MNKIINLALTFLSGPNGCIMKNISEDCLAGFFSRAYAALGKSPESLKESYPDLLPILSEEEEKKIKFFRIPSEILGFFCAVNKENKCELACTSLDIYTMKELIREIIDYCNRTFYYNYLFKIWIIEEGTIEIKVSEQTVLIAITKTYPIPEFMKDL